MREYPQQPREKSAKRQIPQANYGTSSPDRRHFTFVFVAKSLSGPAANLTSNRSADKSPLLESNGRDSGQGFTARAVNVSKISGDKYLRVAIETQI